MNMDTQAVNYLNYHLNRALTEYAEELGKPVDQLDGLERRQAFCTYMMRGRHIEGAEEAGVDETE